MPSLDIRQIMELLPHRYPMLLIDRVLECDDENRCVAIKNVSINEPFFVGHFPGQPVMPGVLQLEAMAQTGGILLQRMAGVAGRTAYFLTIDKAKFRRVVQPGDQMRIEIELTQKRAMSARFNGKVLVDGEVASQAQLMCMLTEGEAA